MSASIFSKYKRKLSLDFVFVFKENSSVFLIKLFMKFSVFITKFVTLIMSGTGSGWRRRPVPFRAQGKPRITPSRPEINMIQLLFLNAQIMVGNIL